MFDDPLGDALFEDESNDILHDPFQEAADAGRSLPDEPAGDLVAEQKEGHDAAPVALAVREEFASDIGEGAVGKLLLQHHAVHDAGKVVFLIHLKK